MFVRFRQSRIWRSVSPLFVFLWHLGWQMHLNVSSCHASRITNHSWKAWLRSSVAEKEAVACHPVEILDHPPRGSQQEILHDRSGRHVPACWMLDTILFKSFQWQILDTLISGTGKANLKENNSIFKIRQTWSLATNSRSTWAYYISREYDSTSEECSARVLKNGVIIWWS